MSDTQERLCGMVKWFNNKAGFGFITVCSGFEQADKDIFVHYTSIRVTNSQYKYLVQGEYVEFELTKSDSEQHEFHAADITGIKGGPILCETRRVANESQPNRGMYKYSKKDQKREGKGTAKSSESDFDGQDTQQEFNEEGLSASV